MKKIIVLLLISFSGFSQVKDSIPNTFFVENGVLFWEKVYTLENNQKFEDIKKNLKLKFLTESTGESKNIEINCSSCSMFIGSPLSINFQIDYKDNKYKIIASNFIIQESMQFNFGYVTTSKNEATLESYILRNKDKTIRQNSTNVLNMKKYNEALSNLFKITTISKKSEW